MGVTLAQYAREQGMSRHTLYAARQAMRKPESKGNTPAKAFVPVRVSAAKIAPTPSVRLPNGLELCFGAVEADALGSLLHLLVTLPCSA